jgi:hypothetical protein
VSDSNPTSAEALRVLVGERVSVGCGTVNDDGQLVLVVGMVGLLREADPDLVPSELGDHFYVDSGQTNGLFPTITVPSCAELVTSDPHVTIQVGGVLLAAGREAG